MNTSSISSGIDTNYKIIIPSKVRKRDGVSVETNTEPWFSICQSCLEKEKEKETEKENQTWDVVGDNVDVNEYAKAINYINSIHNFINEALIGKQNEPRGSGISLNSSFSMPDLPNFLTIFSNICGLSKPEKIHMPAKSTSTTTLLPLCAALKRYTEQEEHLMIGIENNDDQNIEEPLEIAPTSISRYQVHSVPSYLMDSLPKTLINDSNVKKSQNRLKLKDNDSACSCSTRSSEKHSNRKINIIPVSPKPPAKVNSHWSGTEKKYEYLFNKKVGKKIEKTASKRNALSDAEIDLYATQLLNKPLSDCKACLKKPQESQSSKSESLNKQKLKIARMTLEKKKLVQKARDELPTKAKEKPLTAIPVKKRACDKEKCKLKACNSESCHRTRSKRNLSSNWSVSQETAQDAIFNDVIDSKRYATLECSMLQDEHQILKFGVDHPIMRFQLPSLTDMQVRCDNKVHKNSNSKKSITSLPNHIAVALPHTEEKSATFLTKKNILNHNSYIQNQLESKSSESILMDDQDLDACTDSDICDDATDTVENNTEPKTTDSSRSQPTNETTIEPFQQIRAFKSNADKAKFKNFFTYQRKKYLKYSDSLSNDTISSDITSIPDLENEIVIGKVTT